MRAGSSSVQVHVQEQPRPEPARLWQQVSREIERNAIEMDAARLTERRVHLRDERERREEVLAELPVRGPRLAIR